MSAAGPTAARAPAPTAAAAAGNTHWPAVLAAVAGGVAIGMNVGKVPLALPGLRQDMGLSLVQAGWVSSLLNTLAVLTALGVGLLTARLGALRMALAGLWLGALASLAALPSQGFGGLAASRLAEGAGFLAMAVAGPSLVSAATADRDRRFALGLWATYMPLGAGGAMLLAPWAMAWGGWRALWAAAAAGLVAAALWVTAQRQRYASVAPSSHALPWRQQLQVLRQPLPWCYALAFGCWALQHFALIVWLPVFLKEQRGLAAGTVAALSALMLAVNVPGNLLGGALVQRGWSRGALIAGSQAVTGLCGLGLAQEGWPDGLRYALCLGLSFAGGLLPAAAMSSSTLLARQPAQVGVLQGLIMQGSQLGQFFGTPLIAAVVAATGQWSSARWVTASAALLAVALGLVARRAESRLQAH